jgi:hypothetical protein
MESVRCPSPDALTGSQTGPAVSVASAEADFTAATDENQSSCTVLILGVDRSQLHARMQLRASMFLILSAE